MDPPDPWVPPRRETVADETDLPLEVSIFCSTCPAQIRVGDAHCPSCHRPVTADETADLRRRWEASNPEAARNADQAAYGRYTLVIVAGLSAIEGLAYGVVGQSVPALLFCGLVTAVMVGLFLWSGRRPLAAMVIGTLLYVGLQAAGGLSPWDLLRGLLFKLFVIIALVGGITSELRRQRQEQRMARVPRDGVPR
jgi:hypothetical protein